MDKVNLAGALEASNRQLRTLRVGNGEVTMNSLTRNWPTLALGTCAMIAGLILLVAVGLSGSAMGRDVTGLIGGSLALGVLGCVVKEALQRRGEGSRAVRAPHVAAASASAAIIELPLLADATASTYEGNEAPAFAPVLSLTEAQLERQLAGRKREQTRAALNRA